MQSFKYLYGLGWIILYEIDKVQIDLKFASSDNIATNNGDLIEAIMKHIVPISIHFQLISSHSIIITLDQIIISDDNIVNVRKVFLFDVGEPLLEPIHSFV